MRRGGRHLVLAAVAAGAAVLPGAAHAARADVATLTGQQTLLASQAASRALVTIPADIHLPGNASCYLSDHAVFAGTAKQVAVVLTALPYTDKSPIVYLVHATVGGQHRSFDSECVGTAIPAGRYLLQLVHSPGTARVTLSLPGLRGSGTLAMTQPDRSVMAELPPVVHTAADAATATWGTRRALASRGSVLTFGVLDAGLSNQGQSVRGDCVVDATFAALPDALAYAPGCPDGDGGIGYGASGIESRQSSIVSNLAAGSYGAGFWFVGTPTHKPLGAVAVWLTNLAP